jgi:CRISPR-associated exonuclease Cas4
MFSEDDLLPLSGLQHLLFCERQWALIHVEQQWAENRLTQEGRVLHERVHEPATEARPDLIVARGLRIHCLRLGLSGEADVVEFRRAAPGPAPADAASAIQLPGRPGFWQPFPVEYKRGRPKSEAWDEVQLCAQALALEEMFSVSIPSGALFYGTNRRRTAVDFTPQLRSRTEALARRMHDLYDARQTPPAQCARKCENCSLLEVCLPKLCQATPSTRRRDVARYLATALRNLADPATKAPPETHE